MREEKKLTARIGAELSISDFGFKRLRPPAWQPHQNLSEVAANSSTLHNSGWLSKSLAAHHTLQDARVSQKLKAPLLFTDLEEFAPGLIALTGGDEGPLAAALQAGGEPAASKAIQQMTHVFGPANVYVELQTSR